MGIKEKVKKGLLDISEAQNLVSKDSHTYGWCERRKGRKIALPARKVSASKPKRYRPRHIGKML